MCNNTKSYICISKLWSVCVSDVDYCTYNICSACPESLICFQFTFLPGDFYRSTLINHRVIYIKAAPCSGSRSHAMVTEVKFKTAGKWPRTDMYLRGSILKNHILQCIQDMYHSCDPWVSNPQSWHYRSTSQPLKCSCPLDTYNMLPYKKDKKHWKNIELT